MQKVALRAYNREIETLIDQGHTEEAVAHCLHILKSYPKHLETYRFLGKAYLEMHRYTEASDIFLRVLLAVPDDFVAHLGMSIVNDQKHDLSGTIWHMERAFEINSTNSGVQNELRRLYGRRDGLEPARIHLTRGALSQIYMKAGEFQQAISEIKSVLADDLSRNDMKTLLARAYYFAGMRAEALEASNELIKAYPYSLDGNRILLALGQGLGQVQARLRALDPYTSASPADAFENQAGPDIAVMLDKLDWVPGQPVQAAWDEKPSEVKAQSQEEIPAWMAQSGWKPSSGDAEAEMAQQAETPEPETLPTNLAAAEIPDWLKALAPAAEAIAAKAEPNEVPADFDWLDSLGTPPGVKKDEQAPAKMETPSAAPLNPIQPAVADTGLDWLLEKTPAEKPDNGLGWLLDKTPAGEPGLAAQQPAVELPDWLRDLDQPGTVSTQKTGEPPEWLKDISGVVQSETAADLSSSDWLQEPTALEKPAVTEQTPALASTQELTPDKELEPLDELPVWFKEMDHPHPDGETPLPAPEPRAQAETELEAAATGESIPEWVPEQTGEKVTAEESASDDMPDWLKSLNQAPAAGVADMPAVNAAQAEPVAEPAATASDDMPDWLKSLNQAPAAGVAETPTADAAQAEPVAEPAVTTSDDMPDWLKSLNQTPDAGVTETPTADAAQAEPVAEPAATESDDMPDWLKSLNQAPDAGVTETPTTDAAQVEPVAEPAATASDDMPDWLKSLNQA
ncbi:MAG: tetratricopeptide repeat protein, partial [Chloroflexota bacterium]